MPQTTSSSFLGVRNPMAHYIPLWVIVVFTFFVVVLCTMGGLQEGLAKRQFPDTKVNGDLEVTGDLTAKVLAFYTGHAELAGLTYTELAAATLDGNTTNLTANRGYLASSTGALNTVINLPRATKGTIIVWRQVAADVTTAAGYGFVINAADRFDPNRGLYLNADGTVTGAVAGAAATTVVGAVIAPATNTNRRLLVAGNANALWGGDGSGLTFYCARDGFWSINITGTVPIGTGQVNNTLSFADPP